MYDWLSHRVEASPEATALIRAETGETWDYADMAAEVEEAARRLAALGIGRGDHLGMVLPARVAAVRVIHAALRLGATLVPLGERLTARELAVRVDRADVTALVCGSSTEGRVVEAAGEAPVISVDETGTEGVARLLDADPTPIEPAEWSPADTQLILFTSGTTGTPKAVQLTLGNLLASAGASALRLGHDPGDRWLVTLSLHHMGGIGPVLRGPLYGTAVVLREEFDAGGVVDDIDRYDATAVSLVPTMLRRMFESRGTLPGSLRIVLLGGAPAPRSLIERCRDYSVPVYPTYGMTETASQIATARPREAFADLDTVGRPLFGTEVAVVGEDGDPLPDGEAGELVVSGPTVTPGYYGDPEATAAAFGPRGLRTGDIGYRDASGRLHVLNRADDRINTGGENVDPGEVVDVLREHGGIADAAVAGIPDEEWGERVAALVVRSAEGLSRRSIESHCRKRLAGFKLPRTVAFADELPRTVSGTVDREAVKERLLAEVNPETDAGRATGATPGADAEVGGDSVGGGGSAGEPAAAELGGDSDAAESAGEPDGRSAAADSFADAPAGDDSEVESGSAAGDGREEGGGGADPGEGRGAADPGENVADDAEGNVADPERNADDDTGGDDESAE